MNIITHTSAAHMGINTLCMTIINHDPLEGVTYVGNTVGWGVEMELVESGCESWFWTKSPSV